MDTDARYVASLLVDYIIHMLAKVTILITSARAGITTLPIR